MIKITKENKSDIKEIITALENGAVLVLPTDTVYGLVCDATNKKAVAKIYEIKQRPKFNPLPIFVKEMKMANELAFIGKENSKIIKKKWPGKYTFILNRKKGQKLFGVDKKTIALRISKHLLLNNILRKFDGPLAQTSANISGQPASTKINDVIVYFENSKTKPDLIVDGGNLPKGKPSIIMDLTSDNIKIIRN